MGIPASCCRLFRSDTTLTVVGGNAAVWTDILASDASTPYNPFGGHNLPVTANVFGTLPGVSFPAGIQKGVLAYSAPITGVYAAFALVLPDLTTNSAQNFYNGGFSDLVKGGTDVTNGALATDYTAVNVTGFQWYENGVKMGLCQMRRPYATVQGIVLPSSVTSDYFGGDDGNRDYFAYGGQIGAFALFNSAPSAQDIADITAYLLALDTSANVAVPAKSYLFCGDSLTESITGDTLTNRNTSYPGLVTRSYGNSGALNFQNFGWYGATTNLASYQACVTNYIVPTIQALVASGLSANVSLWIGTNDLAAGTSAATTAANIQTMCTAIRAAGAKNITLATIIDRTISGGIGQSAFNTARAALNTAIYGMQGTYCNNVVPLDQNPWIGPNGSATTNPTYFASDGVHQSQLGVNQVAAYFEQYGFIYGTPTIYQLNRRVA